MWAWHLISNRLIKQVRQRAFKETFGHYWLLIEPILRVAEIITTAAWWSQYPPRQFSLFITPWKITPPPPRKISTQQTPSHIPQAFHLWTLPIHFPGENEPLENLPKRTPTDISPENSTRGHSPVHFPREKLPLHNSPERYSCFSVYIY